MNTATRIDRRKFFGIGAGLAAGAAVATVAFAQGAPSAVSGTPSPVPGLVGSPAASPAATPATAGAAFQVSTVDLAFDPKTLTIPANTDVKVTVTNKGVLQHDFTIDELKVQSKLLNGGESDTVTINAKAGTYQYYCSVPGHKEAGMVGTLTVK
jgi:uncharacterized cupredoxin-like copper-binding protein